MATRDTPEVLSFPNSSVARTLAIFGDTWAFLVLRACFFGLRRFDEIQKSLGIARNVLSSRLEDLVQNSVLEKVLYQERPNRYEYRLTDRARDLYPSLLAMIRWGDDWCAEGDAVPLILKHEVCGKRLLVDMVCSDCGEDINARVVKFRDGPGAGRSPRPQKRRRRSTNPDSYEAVRACSVARTLKVIGDPWTIGVIREAFFGAHRFDEIQANLGIARNILTDRLRALTTNDILERRLYQNRPQRYEYRLTDKGLALYPSLIALMRWGDAWLDDGKGKPVELIHRVCQKIFSPVAICHECRAPVYAKDVSYTDGPGAFHRGAEDTAAAAE